MHYATKHAMRREEIKDEMTRFAGYLLSAKFQGNDARDGLPNCYINTKEVLDFIERINDVFDGLYDEHLRK